MPLNINIRAELPMVDTKKFTNSLDKDLEKLFHDSAREFLIATVRRIPVRTGFLRGAFSTLEDVIGAFEFTQSAASKEGPTRGRGLGSRPGRDAATKARKLVRARIRQARLLKRIAKLREAEQKRHQTTVKQQRTFTQRKGESQKQAAARVERQSRLRATAKAAREKALALKQRALRQSLIRQAQSHSAEIDKLARSFEQTYKVNLGDRLGDATRKNLIALEALKERRERKFFRVLKNLNRQRFGFITTGTKNRGPNPAVVFKSHQDRFRVPSRLSDDEYSRRVSRLRDSLRGSNGAMKQLERRLSDIEKQAAQGIPREKLDALRKRLQDKFDLDDTISEREATQRIQKATLKKIKKEAAKTIDHPILGLISHQSALANRRNITLQRLRQKQSELDNLNIVARVGGAGRFRIAGQNEAGKFNLQPGEKVHKEFKLVEFYYPGKGRAGRIQKTPRSGRRFATPASKIITKLKGASQVGAGAFTQLAGFRRAAGLSVGSELASASRDLADIPTQYIFDFGVSIRYLPINDIKQFWGSWQAGITAFQQHLTTGLIKLARLQDSLVTEIQTLSGGSSRTRTRRG